MNRNIRIARSLVRIARMMVAGEENFGHYSIDFDEKARTFTVYFILNEDAVASEALKNANACRYEIRRVLERDSLVEVTSMENNQKSFSFSIVVEKDDEGEKKASHRGGARILVAVGDDEGGDDGDSGDSGDEGGDDLNLDDEGGKEEPSDKGGELSEEDRKKFKAIRDEVKKICRKYNWDAEEA